jgi:AcrR family transcriptional regulator
MNKQTQQSKKTIQALKSSFLQLYQQQDIDKITIKMVTENAGLYRSTFYIHFNDIFDLLNKIEQEEVEKFQNYIQNNFENATMNQFMKLIVDYFNLNGDLLYLLVHKSKNDNFSENIKHTIVKIITDILGIDLSIDQQNNVKLHFALEYVADSFIFLLNFWYHHQSEIEINELYPFAMQILHHGLPSQLTPYVTKNPDVIKKL